MLYINAHVSRKMVYMNLPEGQEEKCRCRERTCGQLGKGKVGRTDIHTLQCVR